MATGTGTSGIKVGSVDIQFGKEYDQEKANRLVQSLSQVVGAVNRLANQAGAGGGGAAAPSIAVHVLATQAGLGAYHTVEGVEAGQVLLASDAVHAHFGFLALEDLADVDENSLAGAGNGDLLVFVNGFWSAVSNSGFLGLSDPGSNALVMWDDAAGKLAWALQGTGIRLTAGHLSVDAHELSHGALLGLLADDHPQYALLAGPNTWTDLQTFAGGLTLASDLDLLGNLEQAGDAPEQRLEDTGDPFPDESTWRMHLEVGEALFAAVNDDGSDAEEWLYAQRGEGGLVQTVGVSAETFTFNGADVVTGAVSPAAGAMPADRVGFLTLIVGGITVQVPYTA